MRSLIIVFGRVGFGYAPGLFPELRLGCVAVSWCRGSLTRIATDWAAQIAQNKAALAEAMATITRFLSRGKA